MQMESSANQSSANQSSANQSSVMENSLQKPNIFTIYTKSGCPFCDKAKDLFREWKQIDSDLHWVENNCDMYLKDPYDKEQFLSDMRKHIGKSWRTFPMIFHKERFVGGYTDLVEYSRPFIQSVKLFSSIIAPSSLANVDTSPPVTVEKGGEVEKGGLEKGGEGRAIDAQAFFDSKWDEDMTF